MEPDWDDFFSVEEVMGGLPARKASALLFSIEGRTAQLAARSRRALAQDYTGRTADQEERAFLSALAEGANLPVDPTIQDLERFAPNWTSLVPDEPSVRAALARLIGEKYRVSRRFTLQLQQALGINEPETTSRFQELHGEPVSSIFVTDLTLRERLRWLRASLAMRLENLPPFWTAFALTLTETVGAGVLALPIAFAELGVLGAVGLLLILGTVNILTIAAITEAMARSGDIRYGQAYFGRLVQDYLGRPGLSILSPTLLVFNGITLLAYAIGLASTMSDLVGLSPMLWVAVLLGVLLLYLRKESLDATVATALMIGMCSIGLLLLLSVLAAPHVRMGNLRHNEIPFVDGKAFDAGMIELIFGVVLIAFFGHTTTANCAAIVLERDPTARSLIRGSAAALGTAMVLYTLWVVMVNGAVEPERLARERGTALSPLTDVAGSSVSLFGTIFVVLAMGMASVHQGWGTVNLVREWLHPRPGEKGRLVAITSNRTIRQIVSLSPLLALFALVEVLYVFDRESFSGPLGFLGVVTAPLISGIFSMLMLAAARRKGDCAVGYAWRFLGSPMVVATISIFFLAAILVHGLVIWDEPLQQVVAVVVSVVTALFMVVSTRTSLTPRAVAEIRYTSGEHDRVPVVSVVARGETVPVSERRRRDDDEYGLPGLQHEPRHRVEIDIPAAPVRELKVWIHELTGDGVSVPVDAEIQLDGDQIFHPGGSIGKIVIPVNGQAQRLAVRPIA